MLPRAMDKDSHYEAKATRKFGQWAENLKPKGKSVTRNQWLDEWKRLDVEIMRAFSESAAKPFTTPKKKQTKRKP